MLYNLRADPFERGRRASTTATGGRARTFLFVPAQAVVAQVHRELQGLPAARQGSELHRQQRDGENPDCGTQPELSDVGRRVCRSFLATWRPIFETERRVSAGRLPFADRYQVARSPRLSPSPIQAALAHRSRPRPRGRPSGSGLGLGRGIGAARRAALAARSSKVSVEGNGAKWVELVLLNRKEPVKLL